MNNIESIDFDNLDIGIFGVYDEEDDDVIMDVAESGTTLIRNTRFIWL